MALKAVVAVYATHPTCPLALWVRTSGLTPTRYRRIDSSRKGVRIPAMRKTLFLVPAATAPRIYTAVKPTASQVNSTLRRHKLSAKEYERVAKRILKAADEPRTSKELADVAEIKGQVMSAMLRVLRYEGRLVAIAGDSLMMSAHHYVAASAWLAGDLDTGDQDAALAFLAGEYLRAYGPARVADFAWWAGVPKGKAKMAVADHDTIDIGDGLLLPARDEAAFTKDKPVTSSVVLLPKWDAYTMGYAPDGRARFVHPDVQKPVYTPIGTGLAGDGNPVILVDGEVVGLWTYTHKEGARVEAFDKLTPKVRKRVDGKLDKIRTFLGA
ncbi:MAG: DNA glycosylase AlkZ-like family protein [Actinomycetota bacterium]